MKPSVSDTLPSGLGGIASDGTLTTSYQSTIDATPGSGRPSADGRPDPRPDAPVRRLVPFSGIQFLELEIDAGILPMLSTWFTEEAIDTPIGQRRVLLPIANEQTPDGSIFHPVTFRPLGPADTLSYSGLEAVEPFLDTWTPLPFLRYLGRGASGEPRFDQGPANWARIHIARPAEGLRGAERLKAVLAFDTRLDSSSRAEAAAYLAPNVEDALFASTFMLVDNPELLSGYLGQTWVDAWLKETMQKGERVPSELSMHDAATAAEVGRFTLAHLGRYISLLKVLDRAAMTPRIRFVDSVSKSLPLPTTGLDLVIDLGGSETLALLVPRDRTLDPATAGAQAIPLRMRDLNQPARVHQGPMPTVVEFDHQSFGNAALSRRSGRPDAFAWGSLVRIGAEARRLSLRANAANGLTGGNDILGRIGETAASEAIWRFSTLDAVKPRMGPMVSGEALRHLSEDGDMTPLPELLLTSAHADGRSATSGANGSQNYGATPVVRPRFSQSSLVGFFLVELILHAMSEVNCADPASPFGREGSDATEVRRIERVVVTSPLAMPHHERQLLIERVNNAIELVWRSQRFDDPASIVHPEKPTVALSIGADVGLQLIHLYDEVQSKFGGSFSELVDCIRRKTGEPDARDNLRVASVEVGARSIGLTIIDYAGEHGGNVDVQLVLTDRASRGADRVVEALSETVVLPAVERALAAAGLAEPRQFLARLAEARPAPMTTGLANGKAAGAGDMRLLTQRIESKVLRPAAEQLFHYYTAIAPRSGLGITRTRLNVLVKAGGGRLDPMAEEFNSLAQAAGARGFDLSSVLVECSRRHVEALLASELWPAIDAVCDAIEGAECDLLLVGGELAALPDLADRIVMHSPVPPGRIAFADSAASRRFSGSPDKRTSAVLGAYLAGRSLLSTDGFSIATRKVAEALVSDAPFTRQAFAIEAAETKAIASHANRVERRG